MKSSQVPDWCKPQVWAIHLPTRTIFQAAHLHQIGQTYALTDPNNHEYPLADCDQLSLSHLQQPAQLIWPCKPPAQLIPAANGIILTAGRFRKLIRLPDETEAAAQSLAKFFNGVVISDGCD